MRNLFECELKLNLQMKVIKFPLRAAQNKEAQTLLQNKKKPKKRSSFNISSSIFGSTNTFSQLLEKRALLVQSIHSSTQGTVLPSCKGGKSSPIPEPPHSLYNFYSHNLNAREKKEEKPSGRLAMCFGSISAPQSRGIPSFIRGTTRIVLKSALE